MMISVLCSLFKSIVHIFKTLLDICVKALSKKLSEQAVKYLYLGKPNTLWLQLFDSKYVLAAKKSWKGTSTAPSQLAAFFYLGNRRRVLSVLAPRCFDVNINLATFFWLANYLVNERIPLIVAVKVNEYFPNSLRITINIDLA